MRCPNCQTMNPVSAKFCLECGNRLVVCPHCGTVNLPMAKFCMECGTSFKRSGDLTAPLVTSESLSMSQEAQVAQAAPVLLLPSEERRVVTIMFADIIGSTPLADHLDPEDMRAILTGYFNLMTEQIRKHGGTVEKYIGDAVMAVFGIPIAHEDDPDRAIRAALDMQDALARFNDQRLAQVPHAARLQMRIGINTGEVASPSSNPPQRLDFLITGDAVNVAARLQQAASPDTILVGERTYLTTRDVFEFRQIAPLHLRGKSEPIEACIVVGLRAQTPAIAQHPRGIEGQQARLVGRSLELTLMHANHARVQAERHPHLITILGTPGIGKSRLVREFIAREGDKLRSATTGALAMAPKILQGRCPPYGEGITYWPLIEILRSLLQADDDESNEDLHDHFVRYVEQILSRAGRSEPTEEIANTILRSVGGGLSGSGSNPDGSNIKPKRDLPMSTHTATMKQSGTQVTLLRAWRVFLEALAEIQPLIIVVDDLQWADEALLDLLEHLTDRITEEPILFLCPARPDFFERRRDWGGGRRNFTTIELEALTREESSELIDTLLNADDLPEVVRNTILTRAEGNPFFVEEIVRMFIDQGFLVCEADLDQGTKSWRLNNANDVRLSGLTTLADHPEDTLINAHYLLPLPRVPDTIQGVLAARVDLLNTVEKHILQHAAIIGRTFWLSSLLELSSDMSQEAIQNALDSLIFRDFIVETEKQIHSPVEHDLFYIFKHVLIRDVVYNNIPRMRRSQEHARLALWLEDQTSNDRETYAELLAYHFQQAVTTWSTSFAIDALELFHSDRPDVALRRISRSELRASAIKYLTLAGDQALHSYYTIRALQAYNDAFDLLSESDADMAALIAMYIKLGDAYSQRSNQDEAWQNYRKALRLATAQDAEIDIDVQLQLYERMTELGTRWLPGFDNEPDSDEIHAYLDAGLHLLKDRPISRQHVAFLTYEAFWFLRQSDIAGSEKKLALAERALASEQEALRLAEQLDDPTALSLTLDGLGVIYSRYHKYNEAHRSQHRRLQLENLLTDRDELYDIYTSVGLVHEYVADYATALMWFGRAWSNAQTMESPILFLSSMVYRMRTWRQWNRWDDAVQVAHDILRLIDQYQQDEKRQLWALETLATIAYRRGHQEEGDQYSRQYKRIADQQFDRSANASSQAHSTSMHAIHLAREDWHLATADYKEKLRLSEPLPSPEVLATLAELLVATKEDADVQASMCERAVTLTEASGARKNFAIALRARGRMYTGHHEWKRAEDDLRQSLQRCEALDLPWERAITLYHLGRYYKLRANSECEDILSKRTTDLGRARYHFEQARGFFASLKALPSVERMYQELAQDTQLPI